MTLTAQPAWLKKDLYRLLLFLLAFALLEKYFLFFFYEGFTFNPLSSFSQRFSFTGSPYDSFSICFNALLNPFFLLAIAAVYFCIYRFKITFDFSAGYSRAIRLLVFISALLLTWEVVTYDTNYFLNRHFYTDRFLLVALTFALLRYPALVPLYVCFFLAYRSQFNYPLGGFMLVDRKVLIDLLLLFTAWHFSRRYLAISETLFLVLVFCLPASHYVCSGIAKILISPHGYEWMTENNLNDFFFNAWGRGWMNHLPGGTVKNIYHFFNTYGAVFQWCTFLTETSILFILWRKKTAVVLLLACIAMHTGIFMAGSILFWKWMALDLLLLYLILSETTMVKNLFTQQHFRYSILFVLLSFAWLRPTYIAWHDTPLNQFFTFEAVDENGKTHVLSRNDFEPYHQFFQLDRFLYLVDQKVLKISGFGYTGNYKLAQEIKKSGPGNITTLENSKGRNFFDRKKQAVLVDFIKVFFRNRNSYHATHPWLYYLHAPHHLHSTAKGYIPFNAPIKQVNVYFEQTWRDGYRLVTLQKTICNTIGIPRN